jgi:hypothetical protein
MALEIIEVVPNENLDEDFITLTTTADVNLKNYVLLLKNIDKTCMIISLWDMELLANSTLCIYSGAGVPYEKPDKKGGMVYHRYFDSSKTIWGRLQSESVCLFMPSSVKFVSCK